MTMADRIAVMNHGQILQIATPAEIYEAPNSRFVADFIGDVNLFDGTVEAASPERTVIALPDGSRIEAEGAPAASVGAKASFAIRPEKVRVSRGKPENCNAFDGELWDIGYLGDMTVYHVKLKSGQMVKASSLNAARMTDDPYTYEEPLWISFDRDAGVVLKEA